MSLIDEDGDKRVRMAHLAIVGSHASTASRRCTPSCSEQTVLRDFAELWPRTLLQRDERRDAAALHGARAIRALASLLDETIGEGWITRPRAAAGARAHADDAGVSRALARGQASEQGAPRGVVIPSAPASPSIRTALFDVQVKRIHEYKRQHLNVLHVIALVSSAAARPAARRSRRAASSSAGKAAPGYRDGQADHPADQRRRRGRERRSAVARAAEGRVLAELQREERAARSIPPPTCPSRSRRRARRRRARAT